MDTRALGVEFLPRGEILTVEMKTVTQYTAQMWEQERIPDMREQPPKRIISYIDHLYAVYVKGGPPNHGHMFPQELF